MRSSLGSLICILGLSLTSSLSAAEAPPERLIYHPPLTEGDIHKIDLDGLTLRLIDVLKRMNVETDKSDPQFGMIYETFDPENKLWVEAEGRDTMHHMMWTMVGLANSCRAGSGPQVRDFLFEYPYAFYLRMMLGGEKYFGADYGAGFCPYYWDDGDSVDLGDYLRGRIKDAARINGHSPMSSVHLAQDLSVGHLDLWWLTGDPKLKQVTAGLYHQMHYGKIAQRFAARNYAMFVLKEHPGKDLAKFRQAEAKGREMLAGLSDDARRALYEKEFPASYGRIVTAAQKLVNDDSQLPATASAHHKTNDNLAWLRLRERAAGGIPAFSDDQAFDYYLTLSSAEGDNPFSEPFARWFTLWFLTRPLLSEYWMDDAPYRHGYAHFPGVGAAWDMKDGRYLKYHSQVRPHTWHTRSLQFAWLTAIALQMLDQWPEMHENYRREIAASDPVVRFTDSTPMLDGRLDDAYTGVFDEQGVKVSLASDPLSLFVLVGGAKGKDVSITVHEAERVSPRYATIKVSRDGNVSVLNAQQEPLQFWTQAAADGVEVQIPYLVNRLQKDWLTAVEHGRHRIELRSGDSAAEASVQNVYFLSDKNRMANRLRETVEGSIVNYAKILDEQGWLPYSIADKSRDAFTKLSFSGAYGHLIHAIAQYQIWKQGRRDWELKRSVHVAPKS